MRNVVEYISTSKMRGTKGILVYAPLRSFQNKDPLDLLKPSLMIHSTHTSYAVCCSNRVEKEATVPGT